MPLKTITLTPFRMTNTPLSFFDGEALQMIVARNGVVGPLVIAIAGRQSGEAAAPEWLVQDQFGEDDALTLTEEQLSIVPEGGDVFFTLWNIVDGHQYVVGQGPVTKKPAIRQTMVLIDPPELSAFSAVGGEGTIDASVTTDTAGVALVLSIAPTDPAVSATIASGAVTSGVNTFAQITGLDAGTYTATVTQGEASVTATVTVAAVPVVPETPSTMTSPTVTAIGSSAISINSAALSDPAYRLDVRYSDDGTTWAEIEGADDPQQVVGLDSETEYFAQSRQVDVSTATPVPGEWSLSGSDTTDAAVVAPPDAPTATGGLIDLTEANALTQGAAMTPVDVSSDFTGTGLTFALAPSSAALPTGLSLSTSGVLSGTPTALASAASIVIRATDVAGQTVDSGFSLTVEAAPASIIDWTPPTLSQTNMTLGANATLGNGGQTGDMLAFADKTRTNLILMSEAPDPASIGITLDKNYYYLRSTSVLSGSNGYEVKGPSPEVIALGLEGYTGNHKLFWQGSGTIRRNDVALASSATANVVTLVDAVSGATEKFYVVDCNYIGDLRLNVFGMDESQALDADPDAMAFNVGHVRNLRLIHESRVTTETGAGLDGTDRMSAPLMDPLWVQEIAPLGAYRDMNWGNINIYERDAGTFFGPTDGQVPLKAATWNPLNGRAGDRDPTPGNGTQIPLVGRMPVAARIRIINELDAYWQANIQPLGANRRRPVWYLNLPMDINDAAMTDVAQQLTTLPSGVKIRVEIGNEPWNAALGFDTFGYCEFMGAAVSGNGTSKMQGYYAHRVSQLFTRLFTEQPSLIGTVIPVAGGWGANIGHINGVLNDTLQQQVSPATTPLQTVLTTYGGEIAVGAYVGVDGSNTDIAIVEERIINNSTLTTMEERAEALYRFNMFGMVANRFYEPQRGGPVITGMVYDQHTAISLVQLMDDNSALEAEFRSGDTFHPSRTRFFEMFRLNGADIEFRPQVADAWQVVASFASVPPDTLEQMYDKLRVTASGGVIYGSVYPMSRATVYGLTTQVLKHTAVRDATGLDLIAYEYGVFMDVAPQGDNGLTQFFLYETPYAALMELAVAERFDAAGFKVAHKYTSHQRNYDQQWGAALYTGHWANATDKWREVPRFDVLVEWNEAAASAVETPTLAATATGGVGTFDATVTPSDDTVLITYDVVDAGDVSVGSGTISTASLTAGQPTSIVQLTGLEAEEHTVTFTQGAVTASASATVEAEVVAPTTPLQSIGADGWTATYDTPPASFDPVDAPETFTVTRVGHLDNGTAGTWDQTCAINGRLRLPYPSENTLTADTVVLSERVYSGDTIAGVTNSSTQAVPTPQAVWGQHDCDIYGNTATIRLFVAHAHPRLGRPVAAVRLIARQGATEVDALVTTLTPTTYPVTGLSVPYYEATLDISGFTDGEFQIDAEIRPWIGSAFTLSVDGNSYINMNTCPQLGYKWTAARNYAYVSTTGDDATGVVSTTPATAKASPYASILGAYNALNTGAGATAGSVIRFEAGTYVRPSSMTRDMTFAAPQTWEAEAGANVVIENGSSNPGGNPTPLRLIIKDVTLRSTGDVSRFFRQSNSSADHTMLALVNVKYDDGGIPQRAYRILSSRVYCVGFDESMGATSQVWATWGTDKSGLVSIGSYFSGSSNNSCGAAALGCYLPSVSIDSETRTPHCTPGAVVAFSDFAARAFFFSGDGLTSSEMGAAVINCVFERGAETGPALSLWADDDRNRATNINVQNCTSKSAPAASQGGRFNRLYIDGGTVSYEKYGTMRNCVFPRWATKTDVWAANGDLIGNWPVQFHVGSSYCFMTEGGTVSNAQLGAGSWRREVEFPGLQFGNDGAAYDILDIWNSETVGDYTIAAASPIQTIPAEYVAYSFDLYGNPVPLDGTAVVGGVQPSEIVATPTLTATATGGVGTFDATVTPSDDTVAITYDVVDAGSVSVGSGTISTASLTAGQPTSIAQITGLEAEEHTITFTQGAVTATATATVTSPVDSTAPTLTGMTATSTGETTASWSVTSNEAGGTIFAGIRLATDGQLLASQIEPGTGNTIATSTDTTPTADGNNGGTFTGLTAGTEYRVDAFHRDAAGNQSPVVPSAAFTTDAAPAGPVAEPTWANYFQVGNAGHVAVMEFSSMWANTDGTGAITAFGQTVRRVDDRSGNGRHRIYPNGVPVRQDSNGNTYLEMDGVDAYWEIASFRPASSAGYTSIAAASLVDPTFAYVMQSDETSARVGQFLIMARGDGTGTPEERGTRTVSFRNTSTLATANSGQFPTANTSHTLAARVNVSADSMQAWLDGESDGPSVWGITIQNDQLTGLFGFVRKGVYFEGRDYGGMMIDRPLTDAEIAAVGAFYADRSGSAFDGSAAAPVDPPVDPPEPDPDPVDPPAPGSFLGQGRFTTSQTANMDYRTSSQASAFGSGSALVEGSTFAGTKATDLWMSLNEHDPSPYDDPDTARFTHVSHVAKASSDSWQTAVKVNPAMPKPEVSDHGALSVIWDAPRNRYLQLTTNHNSQYFQMVTAPAPGGPWTVTDIRPAINAAVLELMPGEPTSLMKYSYARPFVLSDGSIIAKFRKMAVGGDRLIARSTDGGVTWGNAQIVWRGSRPYTWGVAHPDNRVLHIFGNKGGSSEYKGPGSNSGIYHLVVNPNNMSVGHTMDDGTEAWDQDGDSFGSAGIVSRVQPYDYCWRVRGMVEDDGTTFGRPACVFLRYVNKLSNGIWDDATDATDIEVWWARWNSVTQVWDTSLVHDLNLNSNVRSELADIDPFNANNVIYNENGTLRKAVYNGSTWTKSTITTGLGDDGRPGFDRIRTAGPRVWARKSGAWQLFSF